MGLNSLLPLSAGKADKQNRRLKDEKVVASSFGALFTNTPQLCMRKQPCGSPFCRSKVLVRIGQRWPGCSLYSSMTSI